MILYCRIAEKTPIGDFAKHLYASRLNDHETCTSMADSAAEAPLLIDLVQR